MNGIKYKVVGRCMDGVKVIGYVVINNLGIKEYKVKDELYQLALDKHVVNCSAQLYDDKVVLKGIGCQLAKLPKLNKYGETIEKVENNTKTAIIVGKITDRKEVVGYRVQFNDGNNINYKNISRDKLLILAKNKKIDNARVQMLNNKMLLRGVNCDLTKLPVYE